MARTYVSFFDGQELGWYATVFQISSSKKTILQDHRRLGAILYLNLQSRTRDEFPTLSVAKDDNNLWRYLSMLSFPQYHLSHYVHRPTICNP